MTDVILSHIHWDHADGVDLFPKATVWIQREEYAYYTGGAWQEGRKGAGADAEVVSKLVARNLAGSSGSWRAQVIVPGHDPEVFTRFRSVAEGVVEIAGRP